MRTYQRGAHIGPYSVLERVSAGDGMATSYLARPLPGCGGPPLVVLKLAHPHARHADFLKFEVEYMLQLADEHILDALPIWGLQAARGQPIYIAKTEPQQPQSPWYIVTPYMRGGSLADLLALRGRLAYSAAVEIAWQIAVALSRIHARQIVHLDIKPSNILLREPLSRWIASAPRVVVADFGIACAVGRAHLANLYGSAPYTPPERAIGAPPQPYNDLFSLGVLLYEMVVGELPFAGVVMPGTPLDARRRPRQLNAAITPELEQVILRAIATDPSRRYQHARQLRRALEALPRIERPGRVKLPLFGPPSFADLLDRELAARPLLQP